MPTKSHAWERATENLVAACAEDIERLKERETAAQRERETKARQMAGLEEALRLWRAPDGASEAAPPADSGLRSRFGGVSLGQRLLAFAQDNGGTITVREASQALVRAGVYPTAPKAGAAIHPLLAKRKGVFRRVSPGVYQVIATEHYAPEPQASVGA